MDSGEIRQPTGQKAKIIKIIFEMSPDRKWAIGIQKKL
jgi:hypothetical protein